MRRFVAVPVAVGLLLAPVSGARGGAPTTLWDVPGFGLAAADEYRDGIYVFTDYVYDDRGANTNGSAGGDYTYPAAGSPYFRNAADLVEVRVRPDADAGVFEFGVRLNTVVDPAVAVAAIGIADGSAPALAAPWPLGAGVSAQGTRYVLTIRAAGATLTDLSSQVETGLPVLVANDTSAADRRLENTFSTSVPLAALGLLSVPASGEWRLHAVAGLWSGTGWVPQNGSAAAFDLAFFTDSQSNWQQNGQADLLAAGDLSPASAVLDFARFPDFDAPVATGRLTRVYPSPISHIVGEGIVDWISWTAGVAAPTGNHYRGLYLPYQLWVPPDFEALPTPLPVFFANHGFGGNHLGMLSSFANGTLTVKALAISALGAGEMAAYHDEGEVDVLEALKDVQAHYPVDERRIFISGISHGGVGTFDFCALYPDLWAACLPFIGTAEEQEAINGDYADPHRRLSANARRILGNLLNVPWRMTNSALDPIVNPEWVEEDLLLIQAQGLDHDFWLFLNQSHSVVGKWWNALLHQVLNGCASAPPGCDPTLDPGGHVLDPNPARVRYRTMPWHYNPDLGLVYRGAYWVSGMEVREVVNDISFGEVDVTSLALGDKIHVEGPSFGPEVQVFEPTGDNITFQGIDHVAAPRPLSRVLLATLTNLSAVTFDMERAGYAPIASEGDADGDGVPDGADNCPHLPNADQLDTGGVHLEGPDGVGDACQCGDVTGNGIVNGQDGYFMTRHGLGLATGGLFARPGNCDVAGNGDCNGQDGMLTVRRALGLETGGLFGSACPNFTGGWQVEVQTDGTSDVTLLGLEPGDAVALDGAPLGSVDAEGTTTVSVPSGQHTIGILPGP